MKAAVAPKIAWTLDHFKNDFATGEVDSELFKHSKAFTK